MLRVRNFRVQNRSFSDKNEQNDSKSKCLHTRTKLFYVKIKNRFGEIKNVFFQINFFFSFCPKNVHRLRKYIRFDSYDSIWFARWISREETRHFWTLRKTFPGINRKRFERFFLTDKKQNRNSLENKCVTSLCVKPLRVFEIIHCCYVKMHLKSL